MRGGEVGCRVDFLLVPSWTTRSRRDDLLLESGASGGSWHGGAVEVKSGM